jgi:tetratricopeptide (TPR) repeat protein
MRNDRHRTSRFQFSLLLLVSFFCFACETELMRQQAEQIRHQEEELARQRQEIEGLKRSQQQEEEKRLACNRAFSDFDKAQATPDRREAASLYRRGLGLCPDDDVAHYELGKILAAMGEVSEAQKEFEAALRINPNFTAAERSLQDLRQQN